MKGEFLGSILFELIGALTKWTVHYFQIRIHGGKRKAFKEIWLGRKNAKQEDLILQGFSNIGLGMVVVFLLLVVAITFIS